MSGYIIYYTDPAKSSTPINVADNTKNTRSTSLTLIGRNYPGYGQAIAEDLVHLLENFASSTPPNNPIEGQLWFDTSDPNNKRLRVNDGGISAARWATINGVYQQRDVPATAKVGDIWVDTANQQMKFYNGLDFTLVGPNYSSATKTGPYATTCTDVSGVTHQLIINYVNDNPVEIITDETFTPNPVIPGFTSLKAGVNLSGNYPRLYGVADIASKLRITTPALIDVDANNFMRKDVPQAINGSIQIQTDSNSLQIGTSPTFVLERQSGYNAIFRNTESQGQFSFEVLNNKILEINGPNRVVKINSSSTVNATAGLEVYGKMSVSELATVHSLKVTATTANVNQPTGNALEVVGGAGISGSLVVNGAQLTKGVLTVGEPAPNSPATSSVVMPSQDIVYDIGSPQSRWRNVYGSVFQSGSVAVAQFVGIASSATFLASPSAFSLSGSMTSSAVNFRGGGQAVTLNAQPTSAMINGRASITVTTGSDLLLIATPVALYKQTKREFLSDINYQDGVDTVVNPGYTTPAGALVPIGTMIPYAGDTAPPGWLLCNGVEIPSDAKYLNLRNLVQQKYDPNGLQFLTPNLSSKLSSGTAPNIVQINYIVKY